MWLDRLLPAPRARGLLGLLLLTSAAVASAETVTRDRYTYDCAAIPPGLKRVATDWTQPARNIAVLARAGESAPVPLATKLKFDLVPMDEMSIVWKPKNPRWLKGHGGLLAFRTGKAGRYWFFLDRYVWLEVVPVDGSAPAARSAATDAALDACYGTGKNVAFDLTGETLYWLQMAGSDKVPTDLLIVPE